MPLQSYTPSIYSCQNRRVFSGQRRSGTLSRMKTTMPIFVSPVLNYSETDQIRQILAELEWDEARAARALAAGAGAQPFAAPAFLLGETGDSSTRFVFVSVDPANDTPERLKAFMKEHQLDSMWTLVCANDDATAEMANVLGVRIKKLSGGGFDHSNTVYVLGRDGVIAHRQDGLGQDPAGTLQAIHNLLQ